MPPSGPPPSAPTRRPRAARLGRSLALAVGFAVLAAGCSSDGDGDAADAASPAPSASSSTTATSAPERSPGCDVDPATVGARGTHERVDLTSGGGDRWYSRLVPTGYEGAPVPLVVDLHGYLSGAAVQAEMSRLGDAGEEAGFVVATPQGTSDMPYWNAAPVADLPDDVGFVEDVIDDVGATVCIDPARVYVDGFSNGAFLASLVACRLSERVAAVAAVAGLLLPADCDPSRPVPVLAIHGTDDRHVSFDGGPNPALDDLTWNDESRAAFDALAFGAVTETAASWAELDGCDPEPTRSEVADAVELVAHSGCSEGSSVELYVVDGGGHAWPGSDLSAASASILGPSTEAIDATELIWTFFEDHPMP